MKWIVIVAFILLGIIVIARVFVIYFFNKSGRTNRLNGKNKSHSKSDAEKPVRKKRENLDEYADDDFKQKPYNGRSSDMVEEIPEEDN